LLIKLLTLSAIFCASSCSQEIAETVVQNLQGTGTEEASVSPDVEDTKTKEAESKIIFQSGDGSGQAGDGNQQTADPIEQSYKEPAVDWIIVDKSDRNLVLFKNGKEVKRYKDIRFGDVPIGHKQFEGDEKTPEGVYEIDGRNPGSSYHLSLRVSYPNSADRAYARERGKSPGGDIFIHGQPNGYDGDPIGRDWTDGCIALSNAEMREIYNLVPDGAKILIQQ